MAVLEAMKAIIEVIGPDVAIGATIGPDDLNDCLHCLKHRHGQPAIGFHRIKSFRPTPRLLSISILPALSCAGLNGLHGGR